jgi:hypothetical protein
MKAQQLIKRYLGESVGVAFNNWEELCDWYEANPGKVSPDFRDFGDFKYQVDNGGVSQYILNGYNDRFRRVMIFVKSIGTPTAEELWKKLDGIYSTVTDIPDYDDPDDYKVFENWFYNWNGWDQLGKDIGALLQKQGVS